MQGREGPWRSRASLSPRLYLILASRWEKRLSLDQFTALLDHLPRYAGRDKLFKMTVPLLIVTSDKPFGELLRKDLEGTGRFGVRMTGEQEVAVAYVQEVNCPLAFLDAATEEEVMVRIGRALRLINPEIRFVVISEVGWHSALEKLFPLYYLSKPYRAPDLLGMMDKFFPVSEAAAFQDTASRAGEDLP